jgi:uncharacterized small protein (TIGR04563 family)
MKGAGAKGHVTISVQMPERDVREIHEEARRLERSVCWILRRAWVVARHRIRAMQGAEDGL